MRRTRPWLMLAVALASGGVAALLAMRYLRQQAVPVLTPAKKGDLIIAARPLLMGTVLADADVKTIEWTGAALPVGYATSKADVIGRGVMSPLAENEPILEGKLAPRGAGGGLPVIIDTGKRALTMRVNDVSGVAGFVTPNTRVDVC
jgi:Flp pilus assembly protein CpaB